MTSKLGHSIKNAQMGSIISQTVEFDLMGRAEGITCTRHVETPFTPLAPWPSTGHDRYRQAHFVPVGSFRGAYVQGRHASSDRLLLSGWNQAPIVVDTSSQVDAGGKSVVKLYRLSLPKR